MSFIVILYGSMSGSESSRLTAERAKVKSYIAEMDALFVPAIGAGLFGTILGGLILADNPASLIGEVMSVFSVYYSLGFVFKADRCYRLCGQAMSEIDRQEKYEKNLKLLRDRQLANANRLQVQGTKRE